MAVTFVTAGAAAADSISFGTHQKDDYILIFAYNSGTGTPSLPAGWTSRDSLGNSSGRSYNLAFTRAANASTTSGTWTDATHIGYAIYRSDSGKYLNVGAANRFSASSTTNLNYQLISALSMVTATRSFVLGFAGVTVFGSAATPPSGMTNRTSIDSSGGLAIHDTNGVVANWTTTQVATSATGTGVVTLELFETDIDIAAGGGAAFQLVGGGGLVY